MRRLLHLLLTALAVAVLTVGVFALPAMAAEETEGAAAEEPEGFGSGQWDGLIIGGILGIIAGVVIFADIKPGEIGSSHH